MANYSMVVYNLGTKKCGQKIVFDRILKDININYKLKLMNGQNGIKPFFI
jgi:hypothetical protein